MFELNKDSRSSVSIIDLLVEEYRRWILWTPVFLGTGIGVYFWLPFEPRLFHTFIGLLISGAFAWFSRDRPLAFLCFMAITLVFTGATIGSIRTLSVQHTILEREVGPTRVEGQVTRIEKRKNGIRLLIEKPTIAALPVHKRPERIRITVGTETGETISPGDWIEFFGVLRPPNPPVTPTAFDFQRFLYFQQIGATGFSYGLPAVTHRPSISQTSFSTGVQYIRTLIRIRISETLEGTPGAVASALIIGDRGAIPQEVRDSMRDAGLAHLLAISGLHVGLIAGFVFFSTRAILALSPHIALRFPIKSIAAVAGIAAAIAYTVLAGSPVPTLRACAMLILVFSAIIIGRRGISLRLVALAATVILVFRPESLVGASFQLSFAAVTALVASYEFLNNYYGKRWKNSGFMMRLLMYLGGIALTTVIASTATAPFAIFHFHHLATYGQISNLIAVPVTALWVMPCALLSLLLMPMGLEWIGLVPMGWGIEVVLFSAKTFGEFPGNVQLVPTVSLASLILVSIGGIWICLWSKRWRMAGILPIIAGLVTAFITPAADLIVAPNGKLIGINTGHELIVAGPEASSHRFVKNVWLETVGLPASRMANAKHPDVRCDTVGCIYQRNGREVSLVWHEAALLEDCWHADVIVSTVPIRQACPKPTVLIDWFDVWRNGAHALYLNAESVDIVSSRDIRGSRPWTGPDRNLLREKTAAANES